MNTILYRDRVLLRTLSSPIYQNENRADSIKFLVSVETYLNLILNHLTVCSASLFLTDRKVKLHFLILKIHSILIDI